MAGLDELKEALKETFKAVTNESWELFRNDYEVAAREASEHPIAFIYPSHYESDDLAENKAAIIKDLEKQIPGFDPQKLTFADADIVVDLDEMAIDSVTEGLFAFAARYNGQPLGIINSFKEENNPDAGRKNLINYLSDTHDIPDEIIEKLYIDPDDYAYYAGYHEGTHINQRFREEKTDLEKQADSLREQLTTITLDIFDLENEEIRLSSEKEFLEKRVDLLMEHESEMEADLTKIIKDTERLWDRYQQDYDNILTTAGATGEDEDITEQKIAKLNEEFQIASDFYNSGIEQFEEALAKYDTHINEILDELNNVRQRIREIDKETEELTNLDAQTRFDLENTNQAITLERETEADDKAIQKLLSRTNTIDSSEYRLSQFILDDRALRAGYDPEHATNALINLQNGTLQEITKEHPHAASFTNMTAISFVCTQGGIKPEEAVDLAKNDPRKFLELGRDGLQQWLIDTPDLLKSDPLSYKYTQDFFNAMERQIVQQDLVPNIQISEIEEKLNAIGIDTGLLTRAKQDMGTPEIQGNTELATKAMEQTGVNPDIIPTTDIETENQQRTPWKDPDTGMVFQ